jgi:pimeloyl-ACP methyl ester carboxylesterase
MNTVPSEDGTSIAYDQTGEGPPVILVAGALGVRSEPMMTGLAAALAPQFTVYTYDRRGRGDSGDTAPYAVEREIEDIDALVDEAGGSAFVYGISSGAVLALEAAASGLDIAKLALYEPPFIVDDSRPPVPDDYVAQLEELLAADRRGDAVELFMTKAVGVSDEFIAQMREDPSWAAMEEIAHTLPYDGTIMGETMSGIPLPTDRWADATLPTLVMAGEQSPPFLHNGTEALKDVLPDAQHRTLDGQEHDVDPEALAPVLEKYFDGVS